MVLYYFSMKDLVVFLPEPKEIHKDALTLLKNKGFTLTDKKDANPDVIFIKTKTVVDSDYLDKFKKVKYILRAGVGLDNIDLRECKKRKIRIFNAPGSNSVAVAEYTVLVALTLLRNITLQTSELEKGGWRNPKYIGSEIKGKTVGLIGCGAIGKLVAEFFSAFRVKAIYGYDPYLDLETLKKSGIEKSGLKKIIQVSDIICMHVPLTPETKNMIGEKELKHMKDGVCIINASRGGTIDEKALVKVVKGGKNIKVALDVFENEPKVKKEFIKFSNVLTTPHIAGYTSESQKQMSLKAVKNFLEFIE